MAGVPFCSLICSRIFLVYGRVGATALTIAGDSINIAVVR
jgi:hypothetical protein